MGQDGKLAEIMLPSLHHKNTNNYCLNYIKLEMLFCLKNSCLLSEMKMKKSLQMTRNVCLNKYKNGLRVNNGVFKSITERIKGSIKKRKEKNYSVSSLRSLLHLVCVLMHLISKLIISCLLSNVCLEAICNSIQVTFTGSTQLREAQQCQETL